MSIMNFFVGIFVKVVAIFKQLLCFLHIKRRRKNSGSILPLHNDLKAVSGGETHITSLPSNDVAMTSWDTWGDEADGGFRGNGSTDSMYSSAGGGGASAAGRFYNMKQQQQTAEPEPETDYFQELNLEPSIKKQQKIYVRKKDEYNMSNSSRLAMTSDIPIVIPDSRIGRVRILCGVYCCNMNIEAAVRKLNLESGELGLMDDVDSGWADEASEDLSGEAVSALKETRRNERVNRHQEKRVATKPVRKDKLSAVKLS